VPDAPAADRRPRADGHRGLPSRGGGDRRRDRPPRGELGRGIALGQGSTFYAGDLFRGDVFRGDLEARTAEFYIDAPDGRMAIGMFVHHRHDLLFVAGGFAGQAYVYDLRSGATVAVYQFMPPSPADADPPTTLVNDVTVTRKGDWFTDSRQAQLCFVPVDDDGELGEFRTLPLTGPAADTSAAFNLSGIAATRHGGTLVVAHSAHGELYTVDPGTGASAAVEGVSVPDVDGIVLEGRDLWAVQNSDRVTQVRLSRDLSSGTVTEVITDEDFQTPATAIRYDGLLAVVNAKFDTGIPPTADRYEVVLVDD
jgi:hypothetical protein